MTAETESNLLAKWRTQDEQRIAQYEHETMFLVEATDFEVLTLWCAHGQEARWEQLIPCRIYTIGEFGGMPVSVIFSWYRIDRQTVAFFEATSEIVDHRMVKAWLKTHFGDLRWDNGHRPAHCDAMNFHHCLDAIAERNQTK